MSEDSIPWQFGDLRAFFHDFNEEASSERFKVLWEHVIARGQANRDEVLDVWVPYISENLKEWPIRTRGLDWLISPEEAPGDPAYKEALYRLLRSIYLEFWKDAFSEDLIAFARQPYASALDRLMVSWVGGDPEPNVIARLFQGEDVMWSLRELSIGCDFSDAHAQVLAECACLSTLESLEFIGHRMTSAGIEALMQSPHLKGLRRFLIGEGPDLLVSHEEGEDYPTRFEASEVFGFTEFLPRLEAVIGTHTLPGVDVPEVDAEDAVVHESVRERVRSILQTYKDLDYQDNPFEHPFDDISTFGRTFELSQEQWDDPTLMLTDVYPDAPDGDGHPQVYVVTTREGAFEESFDEDDEFIAPLGFRMFGDLFDAPPGCDEETYAGQALFQCQCAEFGLATWRDDAGIIWLEPDDYTRCSDLSVFLDALRATERRGVTYWLWGCHPWGDIVNQVVEPYGITGLIEWADRAHGFDARGDLREGHPHELTAFGDMLCLRDELARRGLNLQASTGFTYLLSRATS